MNDLPELPMPRACPYQPPPGYATLREQGPMARVRLRDGSAVWAVTGYSCARALLSDPRISSDALHPTHPELALPPGVPRHDPELRRQSLTFVEMDDPEHAEHRRMVIPYFSVRRVRALRPYLRAVTEDLVAKIVQKGPPADLVTSLAIPLPVLALCEVFGIPAPDRDAFRAWLTWPAGRAANAPSPMLAIDELITRLLHLKTAEPADDLLSGLAARVKAGELSERQALETCSMLIMAGLETTANTLALAVLTLLAHPAQLATLRAESETEHIRGPGPAHEPGTMAGAVDELLRYLTVADTIPRVALADVPVNGQTISAGDGVIVLLAAANRDAAAFPDPDRLDLLRPPGRHLAFSHGVHQCLGHALARAQVEIALTVLLTRLPEPRLAVPEDRLPIKPALSLQGVTSLPITWHP
ncbi:cytochrome P450 [Nonomuraea sp. NPDC050790]|uniref:cytochrome P450 n=1 Tax=Nonomuraea sp. NPDC050790 TaxID=3364371 RepID=UPI00378AECFB